MLGSKEWLDEERFLFSEEAVAKKRFTGRWGDNK
jgi:hypothetical protein